MTTSAYPKPQVYFDDVNVGDEIPALVKGPMTPAHIMRWSAAIENWHRIHYDQKFAVEHDKLPDILVNGSWKQHVMCQLVKDWVGLGGWLWKISFQFRAMNPAWDTINAWGKITKKTEVGGYGIVELDIGIRNQAGVESTPGTATAVLPIRGGKEVPYPWTPPEGA
jgi:acyl dehydratase